MKILHLLLALCFFTFLSAQEICNNGLDDDADGLIDFNDSDCSSTCNSIQDYVQNGDFEAHTGCPSGFGEIAYATNWYQPSDGTPDYLACGFFPSGGIPNLPSTGTHSGTAFTAVINNNQWGTYKEYIAQCLNTALSAGQNYQVNMKVGIGTLVDLGGGSTIDSEVPFEIVLYGNSSCGTYSSFLCPASAGWVVLGSATITQTDTWASVNFNIVPSTNIHAIAIGPNCTPTSASAYLTHHYFLDDVSIKLNNAPTISQTGNPCNGNGILTVSPQLAGNNYQWYKDGIALLGQNAATYTLPNGTSANGSYTCSVTNGTCQMSSPIIVNVDIPLTLVNNTGRNCPGSTQLLTATTGYSSYQWSINGGAWTNGTNPYNATSAGTYSVQVSNGAYCTNSASLIVDYYSASINASPNPLCVGESSNLSASTTLQALPELCGIDNVGGNCLAANNISLGTSSAYQAIPFNATSAASLKTQMLFTANELNAAGLVQGAIEAISFEVLANSGLSYRNFTLSIACTNETSLPSSQVLSQVYSGNFSPVNGTNTISFNRPYLWKNTENIVLEICYYNTTYPGAGADLTAVASIPGKCMSTASMSGNVCSGAVLGISVIHLYRPVITFRNCARALSTPITYAWTPPLNLNNAAIANPIATPTSSTLYQVSISNGTCTLTETVFLDVNCILPLEILDFQAHFYGENKPHVALFWVLAENNATSQCFIERKQAGEADFSQIAELNYERGKQAYFFNDYNFSSELGSAEYRIKTKDLSGNHNVSEVRSVLFQKFATSSFSLSPNPTQNSTFIYAKTEEKGLIVLRLYDLNGKELFQEIWQDNTYPYSLDLSHLPLGIFMLDIRTERGDFARLKLIKN